MSAPDLSPRDAALLARLIDDPSLAESDPDVRAFLDAHPEHADLANCLLETGPALAAIGRAEDAAMLPRLRAQAHGALAPRPSLLEELLRPRTLAVAACLLMLALVGAAIVQGYGGPTAHLAYGTGLVQIDGQPLAHTERPATHRGAVLQVDDGVAIFELTRGGAMALNQNSAVEISSAGRLILLRGEVLIAAQSRPFSLRVDGGVVRGDDTIICARIQPGSMPEIEVAAGQARLTYQGTRVTIGPGLGGDLGACLVGHAKPLEDDDHLPDWVAAAVHDAASAGIHLEPLFAVTP